MSNIVWTNHALERLKERGISKSDAEATWAKPDGSKYAKSKGAWIYWKRIGNTKIKVVAKKDVKGEWVILSVLN